MKKGAKKKKREKAFEILNTAREGLQVKAGKEGQQTRPIPLPVINPA